MYCLLTSFFPVSFSFLSSSASPYCLSSPLSLSAFSLCFSLKIPPMLLQWVPKNRTWLSVKRAHITLVPGWKNQALSWKDSCLSAAEVMSVCGEWFSHQLCLLSRSNALSSVISLVLSSPFHPLSRFLHSVLPEYISWTQFTLQPLQGLTFL